MAHHSDQTPTRTNDPPTQNGDPPTQNDDSPTQNDDPPTQNDDSPTQNDDHRQERLVTELLLNRRRRYVLYYLHERPGPVSLETLAGQVAAWERTTTPDEVTDERIESVSTALRDTHVPYLKAHSLVAYDWQTDRVTGQVNDPKVKLCVANDPRTTVAWYKVYLALTVVSTVLLGLAQIGMPPFGALSTVAMAALIVALFAVASVAHWYDVYRWRRQTEEEPPDFLVSVDEEVPYEECEEREDREEQKNKDNEL